MQPPHHLFTAWDFSLPWFHGSPFTLALLRPGSTITQDQDLARVFSHKPQIVAIEDNAGEFAFGIPRLRRNGIKPGLLDAIAEPVGPQDVYPHPHSSMSPGLEWLINRPLRLCLLSTVTIRMEEFLSEADIAALPQRSDP